ncbi:hypothetical protein DPMN_045128 [Dreissena polymorpha]|uniref:Uncharacterized protein n=1 Tax=Dreissena polymorpha TaxID=45954 RepID=A0A9D4D5E7_DREPO|nr:hypothetical protein DPMN_045128 [Dreissena polymorpha]
MELYGVNGNINLWLEDFLTDRSMEIVVEGEIESGKIPAEPNLWYSTKHDRKRKLEAEQAGEFWRQYNKKLAYYSCYRRILPTEVQARSAVPAEPYLPYSTKHYRKRKLEA